MSELGMPNSEFSLACLQELSTNVSRYRYVGGVESSLREHERVCFAIAIDVSAADCRSSEMSPYSSSSTVILRCQHKQMRSAGKNGVRGSDGCDSGGCTRAISKSCSSPAKYDVGHVTFT